MDRRACVGLRVDPGHQQREGIPAGTWLKAAELGWASCQEIRLLLLPLQHDINVSVSSYSGQ